jgi:hypothetical protein
LTPLHYFARKGKNHVTKTGSIYRIKHEYGYGYKVQRLKWWGWQNLSYGTVLLDTAKEMISAYSKQEEEGVVF